MALSSADIVEAFQDFDITIKDDSISQMLYDIALSFDFDVDTILNEWLAYQSRNRNCTLNIANLENFQKHISSTKKHSNSTTFNSAKNDENLFVDDIMMSPSAKNFSAESPLNILGGYCTPANKKKIRELEVSPKLLTPLKATQNLIPSSPYSASPAQKYASKNNSGTVVQLLADPVESESPNEQWWSKGTFNSSDVTCVGGIGSKVSSKYMFQKTMDLSDIMNDGIENDADEILEQNASSEFDFYSPCATSEQNPVVVVGRIASELGCRLNMHSILLVGDRNISNGKSVLVDVSLLKQFSFFPGQVVALQGTNPSGKKFIATKVMTKVGEPGRIIVSNPKDMNKDSMVTVCCAAGPFTTSDSLSYEPLLDLIKVVKEKKPSLTILIGPLVDEEHTEIKGSSIGESFISLSQKWLNWTCENLVGFTNLVFVPSQRDVFHQPVYPQPAYDVPRKKDNVFFASDPCTLKAQGINFGMTSVDSLFHLGAEEISMTGEGTPQDRLSRLTSHLIDQQSFYPLYPGHESLCIDWESAEVGFKMVKNDLPDVLIVPSNLKSFAKCINGRLCVNPGRLAKGLSGGSYAMIALDKSSQDSISGIAEIIKI